MAMRKEFPKVITIEHIKSINFLGVTGCIARAYNSSGYNDCVGIGCDSTCVFNRESFDPDILIEYVLKNKIATKVEILDLQLKGVFNKRED